MKEKKYTFGNVSTWLNTIVTVISLISSSGFSYFFFREYLFEIISFVQLITIIYLLVIYNSNSIEKTPSINAANEELFIKFYKNEVDLVKKRVDQIKLGYLQVFSDEVQRLQSEIIDYFSNSPTAFIKAIDITVNPRLLLARKNYYQKNKLFIKKGGEIFRIFLIQDENFQKLDFVRDLYKVVKTHQEIGVEVGMFPFSILSKQQIQDFIIYNNFVVMLESLQPDARYSYGLSTLFFQKDSIEGYNQIFEEMWQNKSYNPKQILFKFTELIKVHDDETLSFDYKEFQTFFL